MIQVVVLEVFVYCFRLTVLGGNSYNGVVVYSSSLGSKSRETIVNW